MTNQTAHELLISAAIRLAYASVHNVTAAFTRGAVEDMLIALQVLDDQAHRRAVEALTEGDASYDDAA